MNSVADKMPLLNRYNKKQKTSDKGPADGNNGNDKGVIFISRLPLGFFEPQLVKFFSQFGEVTRIKLYRNMKSGHSRGYGFIEFDSQQVAQIAAKTMSGYMMFGRSLKCEFVPLEKVSPYLFKNSTRSFYKVPRHKIAMSNHNSKYPGIPRFTQLKARLTAELRKKKAEIFRN